MGDNRKTVEIYDPKVDGYLMYKYIVCENLYSPKSIPVHLSEPFNINVEHIRISSDWIDLELLDKQFQIIDKIKLNTITSIDFNVNKENSLASSTSSLSSSQSGITPEKPPQLLRSNSISGKAGSLLGLSPDLGLNSDTPPPVSSKKANMLLGLEEEPSGNKSPLSKKSALTNSSSASPKFGLLARSASNTLLNANIGKKETSSSNDIVSSSPGGQSFLMMSSSPGGSSLSVSIGGSGGGSNLSSSTSSLSSSSNSFLGSSVSSSSPLNSSGIGARSNSQSDTSLNHYNQGFQIQTKSLNYSFNSRDREELLAILDSIKMISSGKPHQEHSILIFDSLIEALALANQCKVPIVPSLPTSPPPPPPLLKLNQSS
ncbi:hypothetical protein DLAC_01172 [Tieghemostelium lacteum]|uniref:Uncharacterized protein n=1 Tax=Tieghemostelium lacteum TaxID=361077 RepID=A0A152A7Y1_TIELA|nr:hypothetical protein DLAC_01172 [Tieghemostelium lacteum]|eukprot:KYR02342.1 hypothetical protein DLAC_01172 [Tieghemostelium lacteum]